MCKHFVLESKYVDEEAEVLQCSLQLSVFNSITRIFWGETRVYIFCLCIDIEFGGLREEKLTRSKNYL